jgi:hypothetical protein
VPAFESLIDVSLVTDVANLGVIGLNQNSNFRDLTCESFRTLILALAFILSDCLAFLSASGFASSSVLYNLGDPLFLYDVYTVAPFQVSRYLLTIWVSAHLVYGVLDTEGYSQQRYSLRKHNCH